MFDDKEPEDILGETGADAPKPVPPTSPVAPGGAMEDKQAPKKPVPPAPSQPPEPSAPAQPPPAKAPPMKAAPAAPPPPAEPVAPIPSLKSQQGNLVKYFMIALLVIIVLAAAGLISYWLLGRSAEPSVSLLGEDEVQVEVEVEDEEPEEEDEEVEPEPEPELDTDRDGLSDIVEAEMGTSITNADTDADGLSDYEELNTWNTDPIDPDTDGDSYIDGAEVDAGFDPNGPGQLFELPTE